MRFVSTTVALLPTLSMINDDTKVSCSKSGYAHNACHVQKPLLLCDLQIEMAVHRANTIDVDTKLVLHNDKIAR